MIDLLFINMCKHPGVAPQTIAAIIRVESGGNPLAININKVKVDFPKPTTRPMAERLAVGLMEKGHRLDLGLMQINQTNLSYLNLSVADAFDPCKSIRAGSRLLSENYSIAELVYGSGQLALRAALSSYNTGDFHRGFRNGYVGKFYPRTPDVHQNPYTASTSVDITQKEINLESPGNSATEKRNAANP